jgi:hypothetical protein
MSVLEFNQECYRVLLERYLFGFRIFRRQYDFNSADSATRFYEQLTHKLGNALI